MRTILLLLITLNLSAQSNFDYLLFGKSQEYVKHQYFDLGHTLISKTIDDECVVLLFTSPRQGFGAISYTFVNDSCTSVKFYFASKFRHGVKKYMNGHFTKERVGWSWDNYIVNIDKLSKKIMFLDYEKR
jgi:hypothetical protein